MNTNEDFDSQNPKLLLVESKDTLEFLARVLVADSIWNVAPVVDEPQIRLYQWTIKRMKEGNFFVGTHGFTGRVSTAIKTFDPETKKGITESGRVYELLGDAGYSSNGEYVWEMYKRANKLTELDSSKE